MSVLDKFRLDGKAAVITGGAGLLGKQHAIALSSAGATCVLVDINKSRLLDSQSDLKENHNIEVAIYECDLTVEEQVAELTDKILIDQGRIDVLVNNAAINPTMKKEDKTIELSRLENFLLDQWDIELRVGLTSAFLCSKYMGAKMAEQKSGVIINIASDLAVIAPDQRIYRQDGLPEHLQAMKPITYSVIKHGLVGMTKYLATYWAASNVRVNALSPGGVFDGQDEIFVNKLTNLIPMGRMANIDEYHTALVFLASDASKYMTGHNLVIDGGRTVW